MSLVEIHTYGTERRMGREFIDKVGILEDTIVAHAGYNYPIRRNNPADRLAYLNTLSSISGVMLGRVSDTLGDSELMLYEDGLRKFRQGKPIPSPKGIGRLLLEELITTVLPKDIEYLRIVVAEKARHALEDYYMSVGEALREKGKILRAFYYGGYSHNDGVCFQLHD